MSEKHNFIGIGKTKHNSSVCLITQSGTEDVLEIYLTERLDRQKNSGSWPVLALEKVKKILNNEQISIAENRDMQNPEEMEETLNQHYPFYDSLVQRGLERFVKKFNKDIVTIDHHLAHAYAALALSPFTNSVIIVMDGAGSATQVKNEFQECSIYIQRNEQLELVKTRNVSFYKHDNTYWTNRPGALYEKASEYIFNNQNSAGKVMGLAAFGKPEEIKDIENFQIKIGKKNLVQGSGKHEWGLSSEHTEFIQCAADVQKYLEDDYEITIQEIKKSFPGINNLILTGGCALNCTSNAKIYYSKQFERMYIPPFPGDESIGFGAAKFLQFSLNPGQWRSLNYSNQTAYYGPQSSTPTDEIVKKVYSNTQYIITKHDNIESIVSDYLVDGKIIAWFQGRSEVGPRALGNRSILVRPDREGIKDYLNNEIKFREKFRPYGCSIPYEYATKYFEVDENFENPFMSYAVKVKDNWKNVLKEVSHVDGTSRMQTVRSEQNEKFYNLIKNVGDKTGVYCLLNTSLNVMNEPIVETVEDAKIFFDSSKIDLLVVGNFTIIKR